MWDKFEDKFDDFKRFLSHPVTRIYIAGVLVGTGVTMIAMSKTRTVNRQYFIEVSPKDLKKLLAQDFAGAAIFPKEPNAIFFYVDKVPFQK